tara:strand:+ start:1232 stop:1570 length:339 start_codon:yes stop_codon:yes gene_type:complete
MKKLLITLFALPLFILAQSPCDADVCVVQFNAGWNNTNNVEWVDNLKDCEIQYIDIAFDTEAQSKYEIVVVPTIIVFNGKEVKRFQADISFAMKATKEDVQTIVDEILMSDF